MDLELLYFPYSPYNEKARWALEIKGLAYKSKPLLPGPHLGMVRKLTGQTATPVLRIDGRNIAGSAAILAELDCRQPDPPFLPADPAQARAALEIQRQFDDDLGPRIRRAVLDAIIGHPFYTARVFGEGQSASMRAFYGAIFPLARPLIRKGNGMAARSTIEDGYTATQQGLDFVAEHARATGYLVGNGFTLADLTAAAILAPAVDPPGSPMERPRQRPASLERWLNRWHAHPGRQWVLDIYAKHRKRR